jgi:hypothetical protein
MDDLSTPPTVSKFTQIAVGVVGAGALGTYAIHGILKSALHLPVRGGGRFQVEGLDAAILGTAYVGLAALLHFHFFWGGHSSLWRYRSHGVIVSLGIFAICLSWFGYRFAARF